MPYAVFIPFKKIAVVKGIANQTTISKEDIAPLVEEPKLSDIEIIREHNIDERKKLFEELKISQMKAGISNDLKYVVFLILFYCYDCINVINFI